MHFVYYNWRMRCRIHTPTGTYNMVREKLIVLTTINTRRVGRGVRGCADNKLSCAKCTRTRGTEHTMSSRRVRKYTHTYTQTCTQTHTYAHVIAVWNRVFLYFYNYTRVDTNARGQSLCIFRVVSTDNTTLRRPEAVAVIGSGTLLHLYGQHPRGTVNIHRTVYNIIVE